VAVKDDVPVAHFVEERIVPGGLSIPASLRGVEVHTEIRSVGYLKPIAFGGQFFPPTIEVHAPILPQKDSRPPITGNMGG
jgi:hypothetical protein